MHLEKLVSDTGIKLKLNIKNVMPLVGINTDIETHRAEF